MNGKAPHLEIVVGKNPKIRLVWQSLTPIAKRDFESWVASAKQAETRARRIEKACNMLLEGKRRPCCYSRVPLSLYRALASNESAKKGWKLLSPDEKRDRVDWLEEVSDPVVYASRVNKVCKQLAARTG